MSENLALNLVIDAKTGKLIGGLNKGEKALVEFESKVKRTDKASNKANSTVGMFAKGMKMLSLAVGGLAMGALVTQVYQGIDAMQGMEAQLLTITGSVNDAGLEMDRLVGFAKKTPFTIQQSVDAFSRLINMGLNPSEEAMMSYGNTAAAMGKDMMQMVEAVADAAVGEFERLKEFGIKAKNNGDSIAFTFQGNTKSIKNDAASIEEYLQSIGENEFAGAMTNQMTRLSAKTSNLGISFMELSATLGDAGLTAVFGYAIDSASTLVDWLNNLIESGELFDEYTIWMNQLSEAWSGFKDDFSITDEVGGISAAFDALSDYGSAFMDKMGERFDYLFEVLRDYPAHMRTILAIVFGEVQILWEKVQLGTVLFFSFLDEGWQNMSHAAGKAWGFIELSFASLSDSILDMMGGAIETVADGIALIPGMGDQAESIRHAAEAMKGMATGVAEVKAAQDAANAAHAKQIEIINLTRESAKASSAQTIKEIDARILKTIKERDVLIEKSNKARAAAADERKAEVDKKKAATEKLQKDREAENQVQDATGGIEDLRKEIDKMGDSWNNTGDLMTKAFGSVADNIDKMSASFIEFGTVQQAIDKERAKIAKNYSKDSDEYADQMRSLSIEESRLNDKKVKAAISGTATIAGAASQMFSEQSKGREALHKIEQAFTVIEVALAMQKAAANALAAITAQGSGDPYTAFARVAAMAAIMAGLGVFTGSVSGSSVSAADRQAAQGTGTVLGSDDKSESIANATERMYDLELDQYAELISMNSALRSLNVNITHLVTSLVSGFGKFDGDGYSGTLGTTSKYNSRGMVEEIATKVSKVLSPIGFFGDPLGALVDKAIGSFNTTKKSLQDSGIEIGSQTIGDILASGSADASQYFDIETEKKKFWGISKSTTYSRENQAISENIQRELGLVFGSIADTINSSIDILGVDVTNELSTFLIDLPEISLKDLSGEEIQAELEAVFSQQADLMAEYVLPGIKEFQKVGEGLYDTLVRVAQEQVVFNNILDLTGQSLGELDAAGRINASQSIIELAGSISDLNDAANDYFVNFYSEAEQFEHLQGQVTDAFGQLNVALPESRDGFRGLIESLDLTTAEGQALYTSLLQLSPQMSDYYDQVEDNADLAKQIANEQAETAANLAAEELALIEARRKNIESLTSEINELVNQIIPEDSLNNQLSAAQELYDIEMRRYSEAVAANQSLGNFLDDLAYNNLDDAGKINSTQSQFDDAIAKAMAGDAESVGDATRLASQLLSLTQGTDEYSAIFTDINRTLTSVQSVFSSIAEPDNSDVQSIQDQIKAEENAVLGNLLGDKISELAEASDQNINEVIESLGLNLDALGDALNLNLLELINVTKGEDAISEVLTGNVVALPTTNLTPEVQGGTLASGTTQAAAEQYESQIGLMQSAIDLNKESLQKQSRQIDLAERTLQTNSEQLLQTISSQNQIIGILQSQLSELRESTRNQAEANSNMINKLRQA